MDDINTLERNVDVLLNALTVIGLAVNTGETKYMEQDVAEAWLQMSISGKLSIPKKM